jgi:hypothetical protein
MISILSLAIIQVTTVILFLRKCRKTGSNWDNKTKLLFWLSIITSSTSIIINAYLLLR